MLNIHKKGKVFGRRLVIIAGLKASLLMSLVARLYYLQVIKSEQYKDIAENNSTKLKLILPLRGKIFDRHGHILAGNHNYYRIIIDRESLKKKEELVDKIIEILSLNPDEKKDILKRIDKNKNKTNIILKEFLTWEDVAKIEVNAPILQGISIDLGWQRYYTGGESLSHLIGYMGKVSENEINPNPILKHPDFKIGKEGIEKSLEKQLRGKAGAKKIEVNSAGISVREISREDSQSGKDIYLTIDKELQKFTSKRLEGLSASVVVLNVNSGEVLSFISSPGFNPDEFTNGVSSEYWNYLMQDYYKPLLNKTISNQYPPGSTFKPLVALAGLEYGMQPEKTVYCPGFMKLGRRRFHCWKRVGHGHLNMQEAIMHSCNVYFYHIAKTIGVENIYQMSKKFGLGEKIGIILNGERPGLLPNKQWKMSKYQIPWQIGDTLNVGIGQGYVLSTPLQLALMTAKIASGKNVEISFIRNRKKIISNFPDMDISQKSFELVRAGMNDVVNNIKGTAYSSRIQVEGMSMAGKTGTAQVISKKALDKIKDNISGRKLELTQNHALFVGYGPVEKPKYAISVIVEHGGGGSSTAAPIAKDILTKAQEMYI